MISAPSCEAAPENDAAPAVAAEPTSMAWRTLGSWSGDGSRQTESFDVTTGALRLVWATKPEGSGQGVLRVTLYSSISGRPLQAVVDTTGVASDTTRFGDDPRTAYLLVESEGAAWSMELQEATPTRAAP